MIRKSDRIRLKKTQRNKKNKSTHADTQNHPTPHTRHTHKTHTPLTHTYTTHTHKAFTQSSHLTTFTIKHERFYCETLNKKFETLRIKLETTTIQYEINTYLKS